VGSRRNGPRDAVKDDATDGRGIAVFQALENGVVFAIDRKNAATVAGGGFHDDLAGHDEDFLAGHGDVFAGLECG